MAIETVTDETFDVDVLQADTLVIVDFWAQWCGPCKALMKVLEEYEQQSGDDLKVVKLNADENLEVPQRFGVRGLPTLMIFQDGALQSSRTGNLSLDALRAWVSNQN